ncbi:deaminase [Kocuria rosea]|uniref:dCMP deaminase n=1 Tax=Kocuria rosea TaxID=1275 RepID=A0A4R5YBV7_KOCRO|nr:deaminase [Kocuria rosea]TDL42461.1 dCMP deaminase [Kocuria rosea]
MATEELPLETLQTHAALALTIAAQSIGTTKVGAVIVRGEEVVATGCKGEVAGLHAEQVALDKATDAGADLSACTILTTLEPCANSRTGRVSCAELIVRAKIPVIYIGVYDRNAQVYRLGWKHLIESGVAVKDFPSDLRASAETLAQPFAEHFTSGTGLSGGAKFDFTQNGGLFTIRRDDTPEAPAWETRWTNCSADAIYAYGGYAGVVAHARFATGFAQIDDPAALDYGGSSARIPVRGVAVFRNDRKFVLCRVEAIEPTPDYGGGLHASVKITWEIREP